MVKHPHNRQERLAKKKLDEKPTKKEDHAGHVWRKLRKEQLKEKDTEDALEQFFSNVPR